MQRAGNVQIIDIPPAAAQQRAVLDAHHAAADRRWSGRRHLRARSYDALRICAPPPRRPSRIASARFIENSRVFGS